MPDQQADCSSCSAAARSVENKGGDMIAKSVVNGNKMLCKALVSHSRSQYAREGGLMLRDRCEKNVQTSRSSSSHIKKCHVIALHGSFLRYA
jgi:hypothetical protein